RVTSTWAESVIDAEFQHLQTVIEAESLAAGEALQGSISQVDEVVLDPSDPIAGKAPLEAAADQDAAVGAGYGDGVTQCQVGDFEAGVDPALADLEETHPRFPDDAEARGDRRYPPRVGGGIQRPDPRKVLPPSVTDRCPVAVPLDADHEGSDLIVVAELNAA